MIERLEIHNFTCFDDFAIDFVEGINIFIGDNGTGKTHILKLLYTLPESKTILPIDMNKLYVEEMNYWSVLEHNFFVDYHELVRKTNNIEKAEKESVLKFKIKGNKNLFKVESPENATMRSFLPFEKNGVYIPAKDMLANAPHFLSTYEKYDIYFEKVYRDILLNAYLPPLRDLENRQKLMDKLKNVMGGEVIIKGEKFFLKSEVGEIDFMLVAEGWRKLALLWLLIRNGLLDKDTILCWDEPETNLNPSMFPILVEVLLELQKMGVQMFIATHSYDLLREFDLQRKEHSVRFYSLYKEGKNDPVKCNYTDNYLELSPNKIEEEGERIYDMIIDQELERKNG
jgi:AAA15 family ATPase/GTPase